MCIVLHYVCVYVCILCKQIAVLHGGGMNHRMGLYDMIMIKDNHIAASGGILKAIDNANEYLKNHNLSKNEIKIEVETSSLDEVKIVIQNCKQKVNITQSFL